MGRIIKTDLLWQDMSYPPSGKIIKIITKNSLILTDAFKSYGSFNSEVVSKYHFASTEFYFDRWCRNSFIMHITVDDAEEL